LILARSQHHTGAGLAEKTYTLHNFNITAPLGAGAQTGRLEPGLLLVTV
jgi:hypothetical protein